MGDSTLATFRIEQSLWDEFKIHCSQNGDSASGRLLKLLMADMGKSENLTPLDSDIDKRIESYLESHLDKFIDKVSRTDIDRDSIQRLDSRIDSLREEITCINVDELLDTRIDHKIKKAVDPLTDNQLTSDEMERAIAQSLTPITDKLTALSIRLKGIESEIGGRYTVPINVESTPVDAPEGITAPEPLEEKQPLEGFTPDNEVLHSEEKTEAIEVNLEGQSSEVTENNIGLTDVELMNTLTVGSRAISLAKQGASSPSAKRILSVYRWDKQQGLWFLR